MTGNPYRQILTGILIAALFGVLLFGAIALSLSETGTGPAVAEPSVQAQTAFPFLPPASLGGTGTAQPRLPNPLDQTQNP